jgi:hypothetical protein
MASVTARRRTASGLVASVVSGCLFHAAYAAPPVSQPQTDLGQTSFLDGEAGPGGLFEVIGNGTTAGYFTDPSGRRLQGDNELWTSSFTIHPAYVSGLPFIGGHLGGEALLPFAVIHQNIEGQPETTLGGVGDITLTPFVQWSGLYLFQRPLSVRLAVQLVTPTGAYASTRATNIGQNAWQLSPYFAFTWHTTERWEISGRLTYDWSSRNDRPPSALDAGSIQAGDQAEMNLSLSYAVEEHWRVGIASYALRQLTDAKIGGAPVPGSPQQAFGIGPGMLWNFGGGSVIGTAYREFATENRPEGFQFVLRLLKPF